MDWRVTAGLVLTGAAMLWWVLPREQDPNAVRMSDERRASLLAEERRQAYVRGVE